MKPILTCAAWLDELFAQLFPEASISRSKDHDMQISAIQLEQYFFKRLSFELDNEFDAEAPQNQDLFSTPLSLELLHWNVELAVNPQNSRQRMYTLEVSSQAAPGQLPYSFQAHIIGYFLIGEECPEENMDRVADVNSAAILYSAVREALVALTGRGLYPPMMLPTVHFLDLKFEPHVEETKTVPALEPKPKRSRKATAKK